MNCFLVPQLESVLLKLALSRDLVLFFSCPCVLLFFIKRLYEAPNSKAWNGAVYSDIGKNLNAVKFKISNRAAHTSWKPYVFVRLSLGLKLNANNIHLLLKMRLFCINTRLLSFKFFFVCCLVLALVASCIPYYNDEQCFV